MDVTLLSGVVRNRKVTHTPSRRSPESTDGVGGNTGPVTGMARVWDYLSGSALLRNFNLRVHKFTFQWDLALHFSICIVSLAPFSFSGNRLYAIFPISVWAFYNILVLIGTRRANMLVPGFGRFKHTFKASVEEFFSPKLLPVLSFSFLLVALSLAVTGRRLGGPPLCYSSCGTCLAIWGESNKLPDGVIVPETVGGRAGCGYANGKEMLGYYTMAQTSFLLFMSVIVAMAVCMAWRVADEELAERLAAEEWLKREDPFAFQLRDEIMKLYGNPASPIRPEGNPTWVFFGIVAALTFTLLGWHNWYVLPPSHTATLLIILNLLTILLTTLILHLSFFGRLLALYKRNFLRVQCLTRLLKDIQENQVDAWWNCRNFVLNDDLALDYDIGGLAVSATFLINVMVFVVLLVQTYREGFKAMMEPPGSYCAYACMYITMCLIKIFSLATDTFQEQYRHISGLQNINTSLVASHFNGSNGNLVVCSDAFHDKNGDFHLNMNDSKNRNFDNYESCSVDSYDAPDIDDEEDMYDRQEAQRQEFLKNKRSFVPNKMSDNNSQFGQKVGQSIYNPINEENKIEISECSTNNGDDSEDNEGAKSQYKGNEVSLLHSLTSMAFKAVNISTYTNNNNSNNKKNNENNENNENNNANNDDNEDNDKDSNNDDNNVNNDNNNYSVNKANSNSKANLMISNKLTSSQNRNNICNNGNNGNENISGIHTQVPHLIPSSGPGSALNHSLSKHNTPRDFLGDIVSGLPSHSVPLSSSQAPLNLNHSININSSSSSTSIAGNTRTSLSRLNIGTGVTVSNGHGTNSLESRRQTVAEMISQIRKYDPYPCILGIPVMPALFATCKFYIFVCFLLIGTRTMVGCMREL